MLENPRPQALPAEAASSSPADIAASKPLQVFSWSAIFFAILQSACSAFVALSGIRLLLGVGALAFAAGALRFADRIHLDAIRIPMVLIALLGSTLNLLALRRVWSLRRRSASAWRQRQVPREKLRSERLQFVISMLTLLILAGETAAHYSLHHHL